MILNTCSSRLTWPRVSFSCLTNAAFRSFDCAAFAIFGSVLRMLVFGEVDVLERVVKKVAQQFRLFGHGGLHQ